MNKLNKLTNKVNEVKSAPLLEKKDDGRVQIAARISKDTKQRLKDLNISVQRFVDETLEAYIQKETQRLKNL